MSSTIGRTSSVTNSALWHSISKSFEKSLVIRYGSFSSIVVSVKICNNRSINEAGDAKYDSLYE